MPASDQLKSTSFSGQTVVWKKDGKEMICIPGGEFVMGRDDGPDNQRPAHTVYVAEFYIDRHPVTGEEYRRFVEETGRNVPCYDVSWADTTAYNWDSQTRTPPPGKERHPVVLVTLEDARAYAAWAGKRLPTEAEWERAARGTDGRIWPWGNRFLPEHCNTKESGIGGTSPVDCFSPQGDSPDGLGDAVGNVWEWTSSLYRPFPYNADDGREDLQAEGWRTLRGGSWMNDSTIACCTGRLDADFLFFTNVGFRCAVSPPVAGRVVAQSTPRR